MLVCSVRFVAFNKTIRMFPGERVAKVQQCHNKDQEEHKKGENKKEERKKEERKKEERKNTCVQHLSSGAQENEVPPKCRSRYHHRPPPRVVVCSILCVLCRCMCL